MNANEYHEAIVKNTLVFVPEFRKILDRALKSEEKHYRLYATELSDLSHNLSDLLYSYKAKYSIATLKRALMNSGIDQEMISFLLDFYVPSHRYFLDYINSRNKKIIGDI